MLGGKMAKRIPPPVEPVVAPASDEREEQTTTRLYASDSKKLKEIAALCDENIPDTFRRLFGHLLDASLIEAAERRMAEVRKGMR
jgi:hypothetical protein